jgi:hypothetical protein
LWVVRKQLNQEAQETILPRQKEKITKRLIQKITYQKNYKKRQEKKQKQRRENQSKNFNKNKNKQYPRHTDISPTDTQFRLLHIPIKQNSTQLFTTKNAKQYNLIKDIEILHLN